MHIVRNTSDALQLLLVLTWEWRQRCTGPQDGMEAGLLTRCVAASVGRYLSTDSSRQLQYHELWYCYEESGEKG